MGKTGIDSSLGSVVIGHGEMILNRKRAGLDQI